MKSLFPGCFLLTCSLLSAQGSGIRTPVLGFAYDSRSGQIRSIRGIPGASTLSEAGDSARFLSAAISPSNDFALAVSQGDPELQLVPLAGSGGSRPIGGAMTSPARIWFSPSGRVVLLSGSGNQIVSGLTATPRVTGLSGDLPSSPSAAAISDDAQEVLLGSGSQDDPVWLTGLNRSPIQLALSGPVIAMAFRANSHDAVAVTRGGDIYLISGVAESKTIRQVFFGDDRTAEPVAVQMAPDGSKVYTANGRGTLAAIDVASGTAVAVSCQCAPSRLDALGSNALFRITDISNRPVMMFDASSDTPRLWFVPADAAAPVQEGSAQ